MMRAWASRADCQVVDEPFYAHYLLKTGYDHPGAAEVIAAYETDWRQVIKNLLADDGGAPIRFHKHMTQHMLPQIDRKWLERVSSFFLIRDPRRMLLSFSRVIPNPSLDQTGLPQQLELFNAVRAMTGSVPPVIEARAILRDPERSLRRLCGALELPFDPAMLSWESGRRTSDGIWAKHWYKRVESSTGFAPYAEDDSPLPAKMRALQAECQGIYDQLARHRIA